MQNPSHSQSAETPRSSKTRIFWQRLTSTVVLWGVVLGALFAGNRLIANSLFFIFLMALCGVGLTEFYALAAKAKQPFFRNAGLVAGFALVGVTFFVLAGTSDNNSIQAGGDAETLVLVVGVLGLCVRRILAPLQFAGMQAIAVTILGVLYVPWLLNFIQKIYFFPGVEGSFYVLFLILITKFSDLGAYVTGSLFGKHKMVPRISPGKTWEGFLGALVVSTGVSVLYASMAADHLGGMPVWHAVLLGLLLGGTAVVGDLVESLLKREADAKDSGRFFPGIGGILDLLDSLLFNAPLLYLYLHFVL